MSEPTLSSEQIYSGKVVGLRIDEVELPDGSRTKREIVEHAGAVVIVPVDSDGRLCLVQQFRKPAEAFLLELPAGGLDEGESPEASARRELTEEIGKGAERWTAMGGYYSAPGFCTEYLHLFVAEGLYDERVDGDDDEAIEVIVISLQEALQMMESGEIRDAKTIAGILRYGVRHRREELAAQPA